MIALWLCTGVHVLCILFVITVVYVYAACVLLFALFVAFVFIYIYIYIYIVECLLLDWVPGILLRQAATLLLHTNG